MLYKSNFSVETAVVNQSGAMEADTISKNEASLKSYMSRGNFKKILSVFVFCFLLFSATNASGEDFDKWIKNASYNKEGNFYSVNDIRIYPASKLKKLFTKRPEIVIINYKISNIYGANFGVGFDFRYLKWDRGRNVNKNDLIEKSFEAGIEYEINHLCYAFIPNTEKPEKIQKWFKVNSDFEQISSQWDNGQFFVIPFSKVENTMEAVAYLKKIKTFENATNLKTMITARQKYPDYKIPLSTTEVADRLGCRCIPNLEQKGFGYKLYTSVDEEQGNNRVTYEEFLQNFPEYKSDTVFKRDFLKSLELDLDYRTKPAKRIDKFLQLFGDTLFAKRFVLNSESYDKYALLWCGLSLTDIMNFFGDDGKLFTQLITKRMDAANKSEIEKYLDKTSDYKGVEEYIYNDYEKTKNNPFSTWASWLENANQLTPLLRGHVDCTRIDQHIQEVTAILEERARKIREMLAAAESEENNGIDPDNVTIPGVSETDNWGREIGKGFACVRNIKWTDGTKGYIEINVNNRYITSNGDFYKTELDTQNAEYVYQKYHKKRTIGKGVSDEVKCP